MSDERAPDRPAIPPEPPTPPDDSRPLGGRKEHTDNQGRDGGR